MLDKSKGKEIMQNKVTGNYRGHLKAVTVLLPTSKPSRGLYSMTKQMGTS